MKNSRYFLMLVSLFTLNAGAYADFLDSVEVLRNDDGSIHYMSQYDTLAACLSGTHLPTAREYAELSQSLGAKGILETYQVNEGAVPPGYELIDVGNPNGEQDKFYFNPDGYVHPYGSIGKDMFWTSSFLPYDPNHYAFYFHGGNGSVNIANRLDDDLSIRCFGDRD